MKKIKYEIKKEAITNFHPTLTDKAKNFSEVSKKKLIKLDDYIPIILK